MKKTTYFYVLKETLPIFFIGLLTFTVILLMDKILKLIELIVNRGVSFTKISMLLLFLFFMASPGETADSWQRSTSLPNPRQTSRLRNVFLMMCSMASWFMWTR